MNIKELSPDELKMYNFIKEMDHVSSTELATNFGAGDSKIINSDNEVTAFGLSENACITLSKLMKKGLVFDIPTTYHIYALDGMVPDLPISTKNMPEGGFKTPHWLPVLFYTYENAIIFIESQYRNNPKAKEAFLHYVNRRFL